MRSVQLFDFAASGRPIGSWRSVPKRWISGPLARSFGSGDAALRPLLLDRVTVFVAMRGPPYQGRWTTDSGPGAVTDGPMGTAPASQRRYDVAQA